jgi:hypothetical protein
MDPALPPTGTPVADEPGGAIDVAGDSARREAFPERERLADV